MKKSILIFGLMFLSCESDEIPIKEAQFQSNNCQTIISLGEDKRGDFVVVGTTYNQSRYKVPDYSCYLGKDEVCDFTNLTKQDL